MYSLSQLQKKCVYYAYTHKNWATKWKEKKRIITAKKSNSYYAIGVEEGGGRYHSFSSAAMIQATSGYYYV